MGGTLTIPEQIIAFDEVTGVALFRGGEAHVYWDGGSVNCGISALWTSLTATEKAALNSIIEKIGVASADNISITGDF